MLRNLLAAMLYQMYKGPSTDTEWHKDLLWRLYVQHEAGQRGYHLPDGPDDSKLACL